MTQTRKWGLATALAVVVILVAGWFLLIAPTRTEAANLTAEAADVEGQNQLLQTQIAALQQQQKQLPKMQSELAEMQRAMPPSPALPSLIRTLSDVAERSGVTLVSLTPSTPTSTGPALAATAGTPAQTLPPGVVAYQDLQMLVSGGYFEMQQFLNQLERMERAILVTGVNLTEAGDSADEAAGSAAGTTGGLEGQVSGKVFFVPPLDATTTTTSTTASGQ
jgi:Tfp pilus assembly protein PilO